MAFKARWQVFAVALLQFASLALADSPAPAATQPAKSFPILEYRVEGNSVMAAIDVERAVTPYLGEGKSIKDVEAARLSLEKAYHSHGYQTVLVNIPQQEIGAGIVRLTVVEAPVGQLTIKGSRYHSLRVISATLPQLRAGSVPNFNDVQKELAQVNHSADMRVTPVLRASTTPGQVDVDLTVKDELPFHATLEANNRFGASTAHVRVIGEVTYDNLFQRNQSLSIQYQTAPDRPAQAKIWSVSYVIPSASGLVWALYAVRSDSNIAAVGDLNVIGNGSIYGVRLIDPLASASPRFYHNFTAGFDYKDFKQDVALSGGSANSSPVRYSPFTLQYTATWLGPVDAAHRSAATTATRNNTTLELGANFEIRALGGTDAYQFAHKRSGATPSYFVLHGGLQRQQILPWNWSLVGKFDGQLASGPLISNEEYGAGGAESVRGYTESERLGDEGMRGSVELRTPQLLAGHSPRFTQSHLYVFGDAARVRTLEPLPGQIAGYHLASAGVGLRVKFGGLLVDVDGARTSSAGYVTPKGDYSAQFRVSYTW
ncbi:MAG: ShlB/FhaC/HecB family hemolysin secretion/activation protein [Pseudomonadota bacterium]|nr:ShlB/FhaC/HecB family hemolysin secretion/activation protein [Pseudomonadota bacterium]